MNLVACFHVRERDSQSKPISHAAFDSLLRKHVNTEGWVNYEGFIKDSVLFNAYLSLLSQNLPNDKYWQPNEQKAYWINAYNAFTIKLICNHYPIESIKDVQKGIPFVSDTWQIDFITIEGKKYNLNNIEHGILRPKFRDARIHAAINCASKSCPKLLNEAFVAEKLDKQLDEVMHMFINDVLKNKIVSPKKAELSKIFTWFAGDFKKNAPSVIAFINKFSNIQLNENAEIDYLEYDWQLNQQ
ncbi:MAG: DUF547 domain-containing protein [Saprospiraceae bacterium]|nr:DUF547 domain-containing protein [Saprospiraceae bacterium]